LLVTVNCSWHSPFDHYAANGRAINKLASCCILQLDYPRSKFSLCWHHSHLSPFCIQ